MTKKMQLIFLPAVLFFLAATGFRPSADQWTAVIEETPAGGKPDHSVWDLLLRKHVDEAGRVDYAGFRSDRSKLDAYLANLADNPVREDWSGAEKMAYWINAYNAFTIQLIVKNFPVKSIMDLHDGKVWDVQWIELGDQTYTLNQIEHDILRSEYKDPRIHFAVNCAARSCPPLLNRAWTASNLEANLEKQARAFINNPKYNKITSNSVQVSRIFEWYAADFGNLIDFLNRYSTTKIKPGAAVSYLAYDWGLNEGP
jgi:hypothetical protein